MNENEPQTSRHPVTPEPSGTQIIQDYFRKLWRIITRPTSFFRELPLEGGITAPLAFALVTHWLGSAASFIWSIFIGEWTRVYVETFSKIAGDVANMNGVTSGPQWSEVVNLKDRFLHWFWGTGSIIADPFYTLISVLFTSLLVFVGARIFVTWFSPSTQPAQPPVQVTFESAVRLICYGMAPMILVGIPLFGWGLASFLSTVITIIGAKEIYRVGLGRAIVIVLFPKLLFLGFILGTMLVIAAVFLKLITSLI